MALYCRATGQNVEGADSPDLASLTNQLILPSYQLRSDLKERLLLKIEIEYDLKTQPGLDSTQNHFFG